jgi:hypothetical protein
MDIHPSQRRISCESCRRSKTKCQRLQVDDPKCVRCTLANVACDNGQQRKVGRPKREALAFTSAPEQSPVTKRQKTSDSSGSHTILTNEDLSIQHVPEVLEVYGTPAQTYLEANGVIDSFGTQQAVPEPIPIIPDLGPGEWPTAMIDIWNDNMWSRASSSRVLAGKISASYHDGNIAYSTAASKSSPSCRSTNHTTFVLPHFMDQALSHKPLSWFSPDLWFAPDLTSKYPLVKKRINPLPFGIGRPPAYYVHENQFTSNPSDLSSSAGFDDPMLRLVSIIHGLQIRSKIVQSNKSRMDLSLLIQRQGPLFIGTYSLVEYVMVSTAQLVHIVASLLNTSESTHRPSGQVPISLISTIMDVYCRLLSFFELFLEHLTDRAERVATSSVKPIPGLSFNGVVLTGAGTQGTLICSSIFYLLGRVEHVLGLDPTSTDNRLLLTSQIVRLYRKLDQSDGLVQKQGIMRPEDVKSLYMRVATILEQLASTEKRDV